MTSDESYPDGEQEEPADPYEPNLVPHVLLNAILREPYKSSARNAKIARGAALAHHIHTAYFTKIDETGYKTHPQWCASRQIDEHTNEFYADTLADALIALAEACDAV